MNLIAYRLLNEDWRDATLELALSIEDVNQVVASMNGGEPLLKDRNWTAEVMPINLSDRIIGKLAAKIVGSHSSFAKKKSSRENGKKGGRPRKAI